MPEISQLSSLIVIDSARLDVKCSIQLLYSRNIKKGVGSSCPVPKRKTVDPNSLDMRLIYHSNDLFPIFRQPVSSALGNKRILSQ